MSLLFRMLLIVGALSTALFFLLKIRKSQVQIEDTIFWLAFSSGLIVISLFPDILSFFAKILGVQSPVNFLYLVIIFLLLVRLFKLTLKVSMLESKLLRLTQEYSIRQSADNPEVRVALKND